MKPKIWATMGLVFLVLNQILLLQGDVFIQTQQPIDYAHWLLLLGALLTVTINVVLSDNIFSKPATILTSLGAIALLGQAVIDFTWWSYGTDYGDMGNAVNQVMGQPSIRIPFITIGPALFYLGLALHAGKYIKKLPIWGLLVLIGVVVTGVGSFAMDSRTAILVGHVLLTTGLTGLIFAHNR